MGINMQNEINADLFEEIEKILNKFNLLENERKALAYKLTYNSKSFMGTTVYEWTPKCADLTFIDGYEMTRALKSTNNISQAVFNEDDIEIIKRKVESYFNNITVKTIIFLFEIKSYIAEERIFEISQNIQDRYSDKKLNVNIMLSIDENSDIKNNISLSIITLI